MYTLRSVTAVLAIAGLAACRYQPSAVPLRGAPDDVAALAGHWDGEYSSLETHRSGTISFTIRAGSDTAYGDVTMIPETGQALVAADASTQAHLSHASAPEILRVTFVQIAGGVLEGALEPYIAPDCRCVVTTVFRGVIDGDRIEGRFETRGETGLRQEGRWRMQRRAR